MRPGRRQRSLEWGRGRRSPTSNKIGVPRNRDGSDGDIRVGNTAVGAKLFGKLGGVWRSTSLSEDDTMRVGSTLENHLLIEQEAIKIIKDNTNVAEFGLTAYVGDQSNEHVKISTTGVEVKDSTTVHALFAATTYIGATSGNHVKVSSDGVNSYT